MNKLANERKAMEEKAYTQSKTGTKHAVADKRVKATEKNE